MIAPIFWRSVDEVLDLGLDGGVLEARHAAAPCTAVSSSCSVAPTLGYVSLYLMPWRPSGAERRIPSPSLLDDRAELPEDLQVEVDGTLADLAAAEVGDDGLAEAVEQWPAEEDRDAARARVDGDVAEVRGRDLGRVDGERRPRGRRTRPWRRRARGARVTTATSRIVGHVAQRRRGVAEERRHHRLRHEVLRAADGDLAREWAAARDADGVAHGTIVPYPGRRHPLTTRMRRVRREACG